MNELPKVAKFPIAEKRKDLVLHELNSAVTDNSLSRSIIKTIYLEKHPIDISDIQFNKIGVNVITDKIWFVDTPPGDASYGYEGIGSSYGNSIANGETKGVIDRIIAAIDAKNQLNCAEDLKQEHVDNAINQLKEKGFAPTTILTNIYDEHLFWNMNKFKGFTRIGKGGRYPDGSYDGTLKIFSSNFVPKGITIIYDKHRLGELVIKKDITSDLTEQINYGPAIQVLNISKEVLPEKVRLYAEVVIGFRILNSNAAVMLINKAANKLE